jgi:hypothetical protein
MLTDEGLIQHVKKRFEEKTGWGDSGKWTNQDFLQLSKEIREQTGVSLSHVTLKRVWGKVRYDSLPNTHTLNTLVQFLGYDNWRDFSLKNGAPGVTGNTQKSSRSDPTADRNGDRRNKPTNGRNRSDVKRKKAWVLLSLLLLVPVILFILRGQRPGIRLEDYAFSSKKAVSSGLPNSVIFDYEATRSPDDSVIIQQSWDTALRTRVSKTGHQHTSVYYYPDFYHATLQVHGQVVKSHNLLIGSNGWLSLVEQSPVPIYFKKEESMNGGKMSLSVGQLLAKNVQMQPVPPTVLFSNVGDFGEIYSDHFVFEASLKNDYPVGSSVCQLTRIYLLCEGTAIWIPLCAKGCISTIDLLFTRYYTSGKLEDLSAFGVDFHDYVKVRIESDSGHAKVIINDKLAYSIAKSIVRSKIVGIDFSFQGTGSVDYVKLFNGKVDYADHFQAPSR